MYNSYTYCGSTPDLSSVGLDTTTANACPLVPVLNISNLNLSASVGGAIDTYTVETTGGLADNYFISPAFNNGTLTFDNSTGLISGIPDTAQSVTSYLITAENAAGDDSVTVTISVTGSSAPPPPPPAPPAPPAPPTPSQSSASIPDPDQRTQIYSISPATTIVGVATSVTVTGSFFEKITSIQIDGVAIARNSWIQTPRSVTFIVPAQLAGRREIQIFNGSVPVLPIQSIYIYAIAPAVKDPQVTSTTTNGSASLSQPKTPTKKPLAKPTIPTKTKRTTFTTRKTSLLKPRDKVVNVQCFKGKELFIAHGVKPLCPKGFTAKKNS